MNVVNFASTQQLTPPAILITPRSPEEINWEMQQVQLGIARRAYELFSNMRGGRQYFIRGRAVCVVRLSGSRPNSSERNENRWPHRLR
jgi:hypothetical protein